MYYQKTVQETLGDFNTLTSGLSKKVAESRLLKNGPNVIKKEKKQPIVLKFLSYFTDLFAVMLMLASFISFFFGGETAIRDGLLIFGIVVLNSTIGFVQEHKAEKMMEALSKILPQKTIVLRDGREKEIPRDEVVLGDIVILGEGNNIPADGRVIESNEVATNDFTLTGESVPQVKFSEAIKEKVALTDMDNMLFAGTSICTGNAKMLVTAVGMQTEFGKIAQATQALGEDKSPLQRELAITAKTVARFSVIIAFLIFLLNMGLNKPFHLSFIFAISLGVAMVPSGLPTTISVALSLAVKKMARRKALVKKLSSVEALGSTTVICSDKTGTITKNEMTVKEVLVDFKDIHVKGVGYDPTGYFTEKDQRLIKPSDSLLELLRAGVLCSNAEIVEPSDKNRQWSVLGDPTEGALITLARKGGILDKNLISQNREIYEVPFTSNRKMMSVVVKNDQGSFVYSKGAPSEILKICKYTKVLGEDKSIASYEDEIARKVDVYAKKGLRVLALASRKFTDGDKLKDSLIERDMVFLGLVCMIDPPKEGVEKAVHLAKKAGIKIIMITGDYGLTAGAIAERVGIVSEGSYHIVTGADLHEMSDKDLGKIVEGKDVVFARTSPDQKIRVVSVLQNLGEIVAVTGDGVNDAPALKQADVGVAMGIAGTDVSKEASDIILLDDNFASIVAAVEEGRVVYDNLKKFVRFIFIANIGELFAPLFGLMLNLPLPLLAIQVLVIDLGLEVMPTLALALEPKEKNVMSRSPRDSKERLLNKKMIIDFSVIGIVAGAGSGIVFLIALLHSGWIWGEGFTGGLYFKATTVTLASLVVAQIVNLIFTHQKNTLQSLKSNRYLIGAILGTLVILFSIIYIPLFQGFFSTRAIGFYEFFLVGIVALAVFTIGKLRYLLSERKHLVS